MTSIGFTSSFSAKSLTVITSEILTFFRGPPAGADAVVAAAAAVGCACGAGDAAVAGFGVAGVTRGDGFADKGGVTGILYVAVGSIFGVSFFFSAALIGFVSDNFEIEG